MQSSVTRDLGVGDIGRDAGGGDGVVVVDVRGDFEVEVEELLEEVFFRSEAVGGEDGGVEGGVRVFERVARDWAVAKVPCIP